MIQPATNGVLRTFVPAKDYELSRRFYKHLGWSERYIDDGLTVFTVGDQSFYLQNYYHKGWADNFMMFLEVDDVDQIWQALCDLNLSEQFSGVSLKPPKTEDWGTECFLIDPSGVLWHFGSFNAAK